MAKTKTKVNKSNIWIYSQIRLNMRIKINSLRVNKTHFILAILGLLADYLSSTSFLVSLEVEVMISSL